MEEQSCKILQLSDCTMMYILSYLDATSLFNLSRTCMYFKNIVEDPRLWRYIDGRQEPNSTKKVQYVCDRIQDRTAYILMKAESKYNGVIPYNVLLNWKNLKHLTILALENQRFDGKQLTLQMFPRNLQELSLKKTYVKNGKMFFQGSFIIMSNLRVFILDECEWLDSNFFLSVAKYENLEILSIIKCMRLHLNIIPYLNVARYGCKKLKIIDCRFSTVGNEILVHPHRIFLGLYFQSMSSYQHDTGRPLIKYPPLTSETRDLISQSTIKDLSLIQYKFVVGDMVEELPESVLYQDPYPECSCGWKETINEDPSEEAEKPISHVPFDDYIDFNHSPLRFICRRHMKNLKRLPKEFKNFFYKNQKKFYPDSSDNDSDSDDDRDCCMFGMGTTQQMIVLQVKEATLPSAQVINIGQPCPSRPSNENNVERPDLSDDDYDDDYEDEAPAVPDPRPSTSRNSMESGKRKADNEAGGSSPAKRARIESSESSSSSSLDVNLGVDRADSPGPSQANQDWMENQNHNAGGSRSRNVIIPARLRNGAERAHVHVVNRMDLEVPRLKTKLRRLSLRGYRGVTDEGLAFIRHLSLDLLDLTYTSVTRGGIEKYLVFNPNCRIIHPNYCVCKPRIPC